MNEYNLVFRVEHLRTGNPIIYFKKPVIVEERLRNVSHGLKLHIFMKQIVKYSDFKLRELAKELERIDRLKEEKW